MLNWKTWLILYITQWTFVLSIHVIVIYWLCWFSNDFRRGFEDIFYSPVVYSELLFIYTTLSMMYHVREYGVPVNRRTLEILEYEQRILQD